MRAIPLRWLCVWCACPCVLADSKLDDSDWIPPDRSLLHDHPEGWQCDLQIREAHELTEEEFLNAYVARQEPVLIRGAVAGWTATKTWTRPHLADMLRDKALFDVQVNGGNHPSASDVEPEMLEGYISRREALPGADTDFIMKELKLNNLLSFDDFLKLMRLPTNDRPKGVGRLPAYIFSALGDWRDNTPMAERLQGSPEELHPVGSLFNLLRKDINLPVYFSRSVAITWHIAVGGTSSGLRFHVHDAAFNALVVGQKRWMLYNPNADERYRMGSAEWYQEYYHALPPQKRPLECLQEMGDLLYVPAKWPHLVLNNGETVAIAALFEDGEAGLLVGDGEEEVRKRAEREIREF